MANIKKAVAEKKQITKTADETKRPRLMQEDVPGYSLIDALRVPQALLDNFAGEATPPLRVAMAMGLQPSSSGFRQMCGAAIAYGLTEGGCNAVSIKVEPLAKRIFRPLEDGDDMLAKRESLLRPRVIGEFLNKYNGSPLPRTDIAKNVLADMGVPNDRTDKVLALILDGAESLGLIADIKGKKYIDLSGITVQAPTILSAVSVSEDSQTTPADPIPNISGQDTSSAQQTLAQMPSSDPHLDLSKKKRVFITHGKDKSFVEPIKKLLLFGELEPVVSVEKQTVSQPVPDKVMNDMRSCGAAIIHVDAELKLIDKELQEHVVLNPNVLIEIGAAMALYGRRFILLVKSGVTLPSNLQGLFEVRYSGEVLDGDATIKLLEAIREMKTHASPIT
jgi:predicted nucleotide-binding protein